MMNSNLFLAGDIGATKTDLAVYDRNRGLDAPLAQDTLQTAKYDSLEDMITAFLSGAGLTVEWAILAVAGPVVAGKVSQTISHLPWELNRAVLQRNLNLKSLDLINDLVAAAQASPHLGAESLHTLNAGQPEKHGPIAVIAPGTGLGEAFLLWDGHQYHSYCSEGGHVNFAGTTPFEVDLTRDLQRTYGYASYELVCSGLGLPNIYTCLKENGYTHEPDWLAAKLAAARDSTPVIIHAALAENPPDICTRALQTFISVLGREAGNLALKVVATGGVYLGGGLLPRILPLIEKEKAIFLNAFTQKGIMTEMMVNIPIQVITYPNAALLGAAQRGCLHVKGPAHP